ncbi:hypothetical protein VTK73DRAFT_3133 [Phialemonium thermophilum]|uniref:Uncharacterized protein n=1 Tax=Phialemonium thermophilum TaxID=223376 RepID=A0ABR3VKL4_9PEZI
MRARSSARRRISRFLANCAFSRSDSRTPDRSSAVSSATCLRRSASFSASRLARYSWRDLRRKSSRAGPFFVSSRLLLLLLLALRGDLGRDRDLSPPRGDSSRCLLWPRGDLERERRRRFFSGAGPVASGSPSSMGTKAYRWADAMFSYTAGSQAGQRVG